METVQVNLGPRSYAIRIGDDAAAFAAFAASCSPRSQLALIVTDTNVKTQADVIETRLLGSGIRIAIIVVPAGEASKSPEQLHRIYDALAAMPADRTTLVVAVGGGVIGDLAGFAAATFNRGLPLLMVPTSLLAMVDSSVGGKTGINHATGKNLIGAFHQPCGVWIDPAMLATLPHREFNSGMAEVIKYAYIFFEMENCPPHAANLFDFICGSWGDIAEREPHHLKTIIADCCRLKAFVVERDEQETGGLRALLNFGHTFGHAYEKLSKYQWLHGEAVAVGMVSAAKLAIRLGRVDEYDVGNLIEHLTRFELPVQRDRTWPVDAIIDLMRRDKKTHNGKLRFILPQHDGPCELVDGVDEALVREVLAS